MIDYQTEEIIPIRDVPKIVPQRPHISAIYRWLNRPEDPLESLMIGGRRFTSIEAIHSFIQRCTTGKSTTSEPTATRRKQVAAAEAKLDLAGI